MSSEPNGALDAPAGLATDTGRREPWVYQALRAVGAILAIGLLGIRFGRIEDVGGATLYLATWVTVAHVLVGEYLLARYVQTGLRMQRGLDLLAFVFLVAAILSFTSSALWSAFFGAFLAIAIAKYLLIDTLTTNERLRVYAREKIAWESPAVVGFVVLAVLFDPSSETHIAPRILQFFILAATCAFALWMFVVRRIYQQLVRDLRKPAQDSEGGPDATS